MILSYLYNKEDGANAHNIQFHGVIGRTMEGGRFKKVLETVYLRQTRETRYEYVTEGRMIYKITDKGRKTIEQFRNPLIKDVFGFSEKEI